MNKTKISAKIVADSVSPQGDRLTSLLITFPRILLSEINTHRMLSKNTSSSRAIPFLKMVEAIKNNPFIPIAWQKHHSGMQGNEYHTGEGNVGDINYKARAERNWLRARDFAVEQAKHLYEDSLVTKQLCNRLLEPFMWTTMLITGSKEGWDNFFNLRCPSYKLIGLDEENVKSRKEWLEKIQFSSALHPSMYPKTDVEWLQINKGQAEIHMMTLAEKIYDAMNESTPEELEEGDWHIPFEDKIPFVGNLTTTIDSNNTYWKDYDIQNKVKISTAMAAHTSYTTVGNEPVKSLEKWIEIHDKLMSYNPPHSSPMEHCCVCVTDEDYNKSFKGEEKGWFRNYKGFKSYRQIIEESK